MWINKNKYKLELLKRDQRIDYLEKQICNDKHIWSLLKSEPNNYIYCCVKCRKLIHSSIPYKDFIKDNE